MGDKIIVKYDRGNSENRSSGYSTPSVMETCTKCGGIGHIARICPSR